jgi:hypothetical protein
VRFPSDFHAISRPVDGRLRWVEDQDAIGNGQGPELIAARSDRRLVIFDLLKDERRELEEEVRVRRLRGFVKKCVSKCVRRPGI